jgi:hypothetical protein
MIGASGDYPTRTMPISSRLHSIILVFVPLGGGLSVAPAAELTLVCGRDQRD